MSQLQLTNDDLKVQSQDYIDNLNFEIFASKKLLAIDPNSKVTFTKPQSLFSPFDLLMQYKGIDALVEIKSRKNHYDGSYMIDVAKVNALNELLRHSENEKTTAILGVLEPLNNRVYTFNFKRINWDNVPIENRWVKKSELRTAYEGQYTEKPFYFLDWSLAKEHVHTIWKKGNQPQPMPTM